MPVNKLVIPRELWGMRRLLNSNGTMCCLGHLSKACGITDEQMGVHSYPLSEWTTVNKWARDPRSGRSPSATAAALNDGTGDYSNITLEKREELLVALFKKNGVELSFTSVGLDPSKPS